MKQGEGKGARRRKRVEEEPEDEGIASKRTKTHKMAEGDNGTRLTGEDIGLEGVWKAGRRWEELDEEGAWEIGYKKCLLIF